MKTSNDAKSIVENINEYKNLIKELETIGIQKYTNNFIWKKMLDSALLKGAIFGSIAVSISFFILGLPLSALLIPLLMLFTGVGVNFWLYRIFLVDKYASLGTKDYMFKIGIYKETLTKYEYGKLKDYFWNVNKDKKNTLKREVYETLALLTKSFEKFKKVLYSQTVISQTLKDSLLFNSNKTYEDSVIIAKEIYDVFMAEEQNNKEMLPKNEENIVKLLTLLIQMKDSLELGALEIPQITSSQSSIDKAESSMNLLKESFEQAKMVQNHGTTNLDKLYNKYE